MRDLLVAAGLTAALVLPSANMALAQASKQTRHPAFMNAAEAGPDYGLQGEYAGAVYIPGRGSDFFGLQIIALGDGKFEAVLYRGGPPGNGWDRSATTKLSGNVQNGQLDLAAQASGLPSQPVRFLVANFFAVAIDANGYEAGRLVKVARTSPTIGLAPPPSAVVLFDGKSTDQFQPGAKVTPDGLLLAGATTKMSVDAFRLHLEFCTPFMPTARGQARSNSGVYIQRRYEVQILDSFGLEGAFNECGALYRQTPPELNMALPPLTWQTYDIWFTPPRFAADGKTKTANARITVLHNGIPIHWHREITAKTGGGQAEELKPLPIQLQDHKSAGKDNPGDPIMYRNIWIVPGEGDANWDAADSAGGYSAGYCPVPRRGLFHRRSG